MNKQNIKKIFVSLALISAIISTGIFGIFNSVSAQTGFNCPNLTTVTGTTVTFVGELTDNGGDTSVNVWFEYRKSNGFTQKTSELTLFQAGPYCITISGLQPATTYHYQAAARNSAGTSFGELRSFTTTGGFIDVDLRANGSNGSIFINSGDSATLSWTSNNADYCTASGGWYGNRVTSGSESTGSLYSSKTFTITCSGSGGSASDSVTISVGATSVPFVDIKANGSDGTITIPLNNSATLSWNSNNADSCNASGNWFGLRNTSGSESTGPINSSKVFTLTCTGSGGSASDSVEVNVGSGTANLFVDKLVKNISDNTAFINSVNANPGETLTYKIQITASNNFNNNFINNVVLFDTLPSGIIFQGNLKIDGIYSGGNLSTGLNLGNISWNQIKTITFDAIVANASQFSSGQTTLTNTATVSGYNASGSDTATVIVVRGTVAGVATEVSTGVGDRIVDYIILPAALALLLVLLFRFRILKFEDKLAVKKAKDNELDELLKIRVK